MCDSIPQHGSGQVETDPLGAMEDTERREEDGVYPTNVLFPLAVLIKAACRAPIDNNELDGIAEHYNNLANETMLDFHASAPPNGAMFAEAMALKFIAEALALVTCIDAVLPDVHEQFQQLRVTNATPDNEINVPDLD